MDKHLYIIAGCNGAGKTTASFTILPEILNCKEFINADEIAKGLSPFQPETVAIESGRIMLSRINELLAQGKSFAFETTLATKSYAGKIKQAQSNGYQVTLLFFWLKSVNLAKARVQERVLEGGHNIPEDVIERRYSLGIQNLFKIYSPIVDNVFIFDNTDGEPELIAEKEKNMEVIIHDDEAYKKIESYIWKLKTQWEFVFQIH